MSTHCSFYRPNRVFTGARWTGVCLRTPVGTQARDGKDVSPASHFPSFPADPRQRAGHPDSPDLGSQGGAAAGGLALLPPALPARGSGRLLAVQRTLGLVCSRRQGCPWRKDIKGEPRVLVLRTTTIYYLQLGRPVPRRLLQKRPETRGACVELRGSSVILLGSLPAARAKGLGERMWGWSKEAGGAPLPAIWKACPGARKGPGPASLAHGSSYI